MTATLSKNVLRVQSVLVFIKIEGERVSKKRSHGLFFKFFLHLRNFINKIGYL